jgi:hypothetical protein
VSAKSGGRSYRKTLEAHLQMCAGTSPWSRCNTTFFYILQHLSWLLPLALQESMDTESRQHAAV